MESTTAMGMRKMGIMELMMCRVLPMPIKSPMLHITDSMATSIGARMSLTFLKKTSMSRKMASMARGALIAIWTNISWPKVSSATGRPVM